MPPRNLLTGHFREYFMYVLMIMLIMGIYSFYGYNSFSVRPNSKIPDFGIRTSGMFQFPNKDILEVKPELAIDTQNQPYPEVLTLTKIEYYGSMVLFIIAFFNTILPYRKKYIVQITLLITANILNFDFIREYANYIGNQLGSSAIVTVTPGIWEISIYSVVAIGYCIVHIVTHYDKKYSLKVERDVDWND